MDKMNSLFEYYGFNQQDEKEYPVIAEFLKELTPDKMDQINRALKDIVLPKSFSYWVDRYNVIGEESRNEYFWRWLYRVVQTITLPEVPQELKSFVWETKIMIIYFVTLFDDVSDKKGVRHEKLLNDLLGIPFHEKELNLNEQSHKNKNHALLVGDTWNEIQERVSQLPRYSYFSNILEYDVRQLLNAMRYSFLVNNQPEFINSVEYKAYLPHNMQAIISLDVDLMSLDKFNSNDLGTFREIAWGAQNMARIGNWISTWEREADEGDYTSIVFASALEKRILTSEDLVSMDKKIMIEKIKNSNVEKEALKEWQHNYDWIAKKAKILSSSLDIDTFLIKLKQLLAYHLSSRGYK